MSKKELFFLFMFVFMFILVIKCCVYFISGIIDLWNEYKNLINYYFVFLVMYSMCNFILYMCIYVVTVNNFVFVYVNLKV